MRFASVQLHHGDGSARVHREGVGAFFAYRSRQSCEFGEANSASGGRIDAMKLVHTQFYLAELGRWIETALIVVCGIVTGEFE